MIYILIIAAVVWWLQWSNAQGVSAQTTNLPSGGPDGTIPITGSSGQSGFLQSDGTIVDADGNEIGIASSSGARPGEPGSITFFGDEEP